MLKFSEISKALLVGFKVRESDSIARPGFAFQSRRGGYRLLVVPRMDKIDT